MHLGLALYGYMKKHALIMFLGSTCTHTGTHVRWVYTHIQQKLFNRLLTYGYRITSSSCLRCEMSQMYYRIAGTFEAENFRKFCCFESISESSLHDCLKAQSTQLIQVSNPRKFSP